MFGGTALELARIRFGFTVSCRIIFPAITIGLASYKVGPGVHFFSACMVALGALISTTWILASNSWMQTPQGFEIIDGWVVPVNWLEVIFNPSFPYRLVHMTLAAHLATALFVGAAAAWHIRASATRWRCAGRCRWRCGCC